jgi:periplasmic protein CpxP/Spy
MKKPGKFKVLAIASLSAVVLTVASLAVAQQVKTGRGDGQGRRGAWHGEGMKRGGGFGEDRLFARLNLTDDQKAKIKQTRQSFMESNKPLFAQLKAKRQELRQASEGGTFNEALATQKLTEAAALEAKLMGARFQLRQQMLSVLTPEQKTQLDQLKAQFKANHGQRRGQGGQRQDDDE